MKECFLFNFREDNRYFDNRYYDINIENFNMIINIISVIHLELRVGSIETYFYNLKGFQII